MHSKISFFSLLLIGSALITQGIAQTLQFQDSPFGFHPAGIGVQGYPHNGFIDAKYIGVRWHRPPVYVFWFLVQPDLNSPVYDWSQFDRQFGMVPNDIHILGNISPDHPRTPHGYTHPGSFIPIDTIKYKAFVKATVERYDGDGINDMPGLTNPIKYWQVGNEPSVFQAGGFSELQRITYLSIKDACQECSVLIGGATGMPPVEKYLLQFDKQFKPILDSLKGNYIDIIDFHWYGNATGDYLSAKNVFGHIRSTLNNIGFPQIPMWITEMGSYSGNPSYVPQDHNQWLPQTERQQAIDYFKRFIYSLSFGVKKIFPAFGLMEGFKLNNGYFDHTGLIYDGKGSSDLGLGVKKLAYFTYKLMTEKLEGSDWGSIQTLNDLDEIYAFKIIKNDRPIWIVWSDNSQIELIPFACIDAERVKITKAVPCFELGKDVSDYSTAFDTSEHDVINGSIILQLDEAPVFIEGITPTSVNDENLSGAVDLFVSQNYPNPFNSETTIKYSIPVETGYIPSLQHVSLKVYDVLGREVVTLVDEYKQPGIYVETFYGTFLPTGIYFYSLRAGDFHESKKMVLLK